MKNSVKKSYIIVGIIVAISIMSSCNVEERKKLEEKAVSLEQKLHERDSAFNEIMDLMTKVESQIEQIKERENIIANRSNEDFSSNGKEQMVEDISIINDLIEKTNTQVESLSSKLNKANIEIGSFKMRVNKLSQELDSRKNAMATLEEQIREKDNMINELDGEVQTLVSKVNLQTETIQSQNDQLKERDIEMHKAFYAVNTSKNLEENGLITKEGGFLWLGKTSELRADAEQTKFDAIDIRETTRFYVNSDKMDIVTEHPSDSYQVVKDDKDIVKYIDITNPEKFWKVSKYLVISVKG